GREGDACLVEIRLTRRQPLQPETWQQENPGEPPRGLQQQPELHRQAEREDGDHDRRDRGRRQRPEATAEDCDRQEQRGEIRPTAKGEARRMRAAVPGVPEAPLLECSDRAMFGAVKEERPAAQQPHQQRARGDAADNEADPARRKGEQQRRDDRNDEEVALLAPRDAFAPEHRRQGRGEPDETASDRNPAQRLRRLWHEPFAQAAVDAGESPEALADDDHTVRTRHPPVSLHALRIVSVLRPYEASPPAPPAMIVIRGPPGKSRAAYSQMK